MEQSFAAYGYPTQKRELIFGLFIVLISLLLCNCLIFGGLNLGFGLAVICAVICTAVYLLGCGYKLTPYSACLLGLSLVLAASFARSDDGFVKFVTACFLAVSTNLGFCLLARKNRFSPGTVGSLADSVGTFFQLGVGELPRAWHGLHAAFKGSGRLGKTGGAVLLGLCFAVPMLCVLIPLLIRADVAFEGLVGLLPEFDLFQLVVTLILGGCLACVLYTRGTALRCYVPGTSPVTTPRKGLSSITVNTFLGAVAVVYGAYLVSQLAYFVGGFAGILPEEYTLAQYARRGFYEMAWLCALNLGIIALSLGISEKRAPAPLSTRLLCLFLGLVTVFLVSAASAKMFLYIESYGLTRLRVLTQVVMLFLALVVILVCLRLFVHKFPYMKAIILAGLVIAGCVSWADVDTQVARYNVQTYLSGGLETVDVAYLDSLGDGALPYVQQLTQAEDADIADWAKSVLESREWEQPEIRSWNYVNQKAGDYLPHAEESPEAAGEDIIFKIS